MSNDTSTTAGKIEIMQAHERGEPIQYFCNIDRKWYPADTPRWSWRDTDYRIKPAPREFVIERRKSDGHFQKAHGGPVNDAWEIIKVREVIE